MNKDCPDCDSNENCAKHFIPYSEIFHRESYDKGRAEAMKWAEVEIAMRVKVAKDEGHAEALGKGGSPTFALGYGKRQKQEGHAEAESQYDRDFDKFKERIRTEFAKILLEKMPNPIIEHQNMLAKIRSLLESELRGPAVRGVQDGEL